MQAARRSGAAMSAATDRVDPAGPRSTRRPASSSSSAGSSTGTASAARCACCRTTPTRPTLLAAAPTVLLHRAGRHACESRRVLGARRHKRFVLAAVRRRRRRANDAEALVGCARGGAARGSCRRPAPAAVYHVDLIGCAVRTTDWRGCSARCDGDDRHRQQRRLRRARRGARVPDSAGRRRDRRARHRAAAPSSCTRCPGCSTA